MKKYDSDNLQEKGKCFAEIWPKLAGYRKGRIIVIQDAPSRLALLRTRVRPADNRDVSRAPVLLERACGPVLGAANSSGQEAGLASLIA